jgi:K+-transporting ATPase KdpF subunit
MGVRSPEVAAEGKTMLGNVVLLGICVLTFVYLMLALLWPERF